MTDSASSHELDLESLGSPRVLVVGDLMLDEYIWGSVSRVSPEAPVPVIAGRHRELKAGGAGSVVENLAVLGARVQVCGLIGEDEPGDRFLDILSKQGVSHQGIVRRSGRVTTQKIRLMASVQQAHRAQQQVCRVDFEDIVEPSSEELTEIRAYLTEIFDDPPKAVLVSDYEKGMLSPEVLDTVISLARSASVPVLVDPGRSVDYVRYRGATLICPNRFESEQATGMTLESSEDFEECARRLIDRLELDSVALTLDREGIFLGRSDGTSTHFPTRARAVTDVAGAGDMVLSLLGLAMGNGWSVESAVRLANIGAGVEVSKVGVTPVEKWEIEQALRETETDALSKVRSLEELTRIRERAKAAGQTVVFANGCFDILHVGHVVLLQKSRGLGDELIVGLNSDDSIRRLKGPERPILQGDERALMLSALSWVDHIVFFDEDTPIELIERLEPDILVKGADYANKDVVGRQIVEAAGGRVELVPLRPEISTSSIVDRIRRNEES